MKLILEGCITLAAKENDAQVLTAIARLSSDLLNRCTYGKYPDILKAIQNLLSPITRLGNPPDKYDLHDKEIIIDSLIKAFQVIFQSKKRLFQSQHSEIEGTFFQNIV